MPSAFISYRRVDSAALATLIAVRLKEAYGIDAYVDTRNTDGGGPFPNRLRSAIEHADVFVCLLSATSLESAWVLTEIEHAHKLRKILIPVFQERYVAPVLIPNEHVEALLQSDGVQFLDVRNLYIDQAIAQLAQMISKSAPHNRIYNRPALILTVAGLVVALLIVALLPTITPLISPTLPFNAFIPSGTPPSSSTDEPSVDLTGTYINQVQSTAQQSHELGTDYFETQAAQVQGTAQEANLALTQVVETQVDQMQAMTHQANALTTDLATQNVMILTPVAHNTDWKPVYQTFDDIEMALVPPGCFLMGSDNGQVDEKPVNQQCFDQPFWIDRYEVTNKQYGSDGNLGGENRPRDSVTWAEARDFCAGRSARLPTEREWEYGARGPDNFAYPWGNDFEGTNVVHVDNSGEQSADVGSRSPAGDSWVGASDLSGNSWEWVSSLYQPYPYASDDGREDLEKEGSRVLRGGSWGREDALMSSTHRSANDPTEVNNEFGFRCARDY